MADLSHFEKSKLTFSEAFGPAMAIDNQADADAYFDALVIHTMAHKQGMSREDAEAQERHNLGYYAGYFSDETRARVERLFKCAHPHFGKIAEEGALTPDEAIRLGQELARNG